jgi:hypothetical protein
VDVNFGGSWGLFGGACGGGGGETTGAVHWKEEGEEGSGDVKAVVFENWEEVVVADVIEEVVDAFEGRRSCEDKLEFGWWSWGTNAVWIGGALGGLDCDGVGRIATGCMWDCRLFGYDGDKVDASRSSTSIASTSISITNASTSLVDSSE